METVFAVILVVGTFVFPDGSTDVTWITNMYESCDQWQFHLPDLVAVAQQMSGAEVIAFNAECLEVSHAEQKPI